MSSVSIQNSWLKYLNMGLPRIKIIQLNLNSGPSRFQMSSALTALPSCLQNCRIKIMQWRVWLISQGIRISENHWLEEYMVWWSSFRYGQCKTQTADYCFHHANDYMTTIVPFVFNPQNNIPQSVYRYAFYTAPFKGSYPFLKGLFRDFQGHTSHYSRTPFNAKKSLESMSFLVLPQHQQFQPEGHLCLLLFLWVGLSSHWNSRTFQHQLQFSKTFKALNFYFQIQGLSRTIKVRVNPVNKFLDLLFTFTYLTSQN